MQHVKGVSGDDFPTFEDLAGVSLTLANPQEDSTPDSVTKLYGIIGLFRGPDFHILACIFQGCGSLTLRNLLKQTLLEYKASNVAERVMLLLLPEPQSR